MSESSITNISPLLRSGSLLNTNALPVLLMSKPETFSPFNKSGSVAILYFLILKSDDTTVLSIFISFTIDGASSENWSVFSKFICAVTALSSIVISSPAFTPSTGVIWKLSNTNPFGKRLPAIVSVHSFASSSSVMSTVTEASFASSESV